MFTPNLSILPEPQGDFGGIANTPKAFVLYGGTALALRLGHRQSRTSTFSRTSLPPDSLRDSIPT